MNSEFALPTATDVLNVLTQPIVETERIRMSELRRVARRGVASERLAERRAERRAAEAAVKSWG